MKRIHIITLVFVGIVLMGGCVSREIKLDAHNNGSQIKLDKGQNLIISLKANPSTGYTWEIEELNQSILRAEGEPEFQPESTLVGAGGVQILRFEAMNAGQTTLKLVYHRPWEKEVKPLEIFTIQVVVS